VSMKMYTFLLIYLF